MKGWDAPNVPKEALTLKKEIGKEMWKGSPSIADLSNIQKAFSQDPRYSMYQFFLLILSGATVWLILTIYYITGIHDIFYYIFIFFGYYGFKYGFKALNEIYYSIRGKSK